MKKRIIIFVSLCLLASHGETVFADSSYSSIVNNVSVSASSGGNNTNSGGVVSQGRSSISASIQTVVNGQVVEEEDKTATSSDGSPVQIDIETDYASGSAKASTHVSATTSTASTVWLSKIATPIKNVFPAHTQTAATSSVRAGSMATTSSRDLTQNIVTELVKYILLFFHFHAPFNW